VKFSEKNICITVLSLFFAFDAKADQIYSVQNGPWNYHSTWSNHTIPADTDSVVIDHYVLFTDTIKVAQLGDLLIDSCGTLCGDHVLHGHFTNYGIMYIGSFEITDTSFTHGIIISNNNTSSFVTSGYLRVEGGSISIGPNIPPCEIPSRSVGACARVSSVEDESYSPPSFNIYPNPTDNNFFIENAEGTFAVPDEIKIYDLQSRLIYAKRNTENLNKEEIDISNLDAGVYVISIEDKFQQKFYRKKIIKE